MTQERNETSSNATEQGALTLLLRDMLQEQRRTRRARWIWGAIKLVVLAILVASVISMLSWEESKPAASRPHIGVVKVSGIIASDSDASADNIIEGLNDAWSNENTRAVVLLINSPGGTPVQAQRVYDEIRRLHDKGDKPIYAVIEDMGASGAYFIASATDKIYAAPASIVGSIGVISSGFGFEEAMKKIGVERRVFAAGQNKDMLDPYSPISPQQRASFQKLLDMTHQQFIDAVRVGRGNRLHENPELFSGMFWNGEQAVELGLVDELKSIDTLARDVVENRDDVVDYTPNGSPIEQLGRKLSRVAADNVGIDTRALTAPLRLMMH